MDIPRLCFIFGIIVIILLQVKAQGDTFACCDHDDDDGDDDGNGATGGPRQSFYLYAPPPVNVQCLVNRPMTQAENVSPDVTGYAYEGNGCEYPGGQKQTLCDTNFGNNAGSTSWCVDGDDDEGNDNLPGDGLNRPLTTAEFADSVPTLATGCTFGNTMDFTRTWTSPTSCAGTAVTDDQRIVLVDTIAPEVVAPPDMTVECFGQFDDLYYEYDDQIELFGDFYASDLCTPVTTSYVVTSSGDPCNNVITRTFTAQDGCNTASRGQQINYVDTTGPLLGIQERIIQVECTNPAPDTNPTLSDECQTDLTGLAILNSETVIEGKCTGESKIVREYVGDDGCGNLSFGTVIISIVDTNPPAVSPDPLDFIGTFQCEAPSFPDFQAQDACSDATVTYTESSSSKESEYYFVTRDYTATDECGNALSWQLIARVDIAEGTLIASFPDSHIVSAVNTPFTVVVNIGTTDCMPDGAYLVLHPGPAQYLGGAAECTQAGGAVQCDVSDLFGSVDQGVQQFVLNLSFSVSENYPFNHLEITMNTVGFENTNGPESTDIIVIEFA